MADATVTMQGIYHGTAPFLIDPINGFKNITAGKAITIAQARGCNVAGRDEREFRAAIELARSSDIVFFLGGIDHTVEREGTDRTSIALPEVQLELIQELEKVVRSPLHIVMMSGGGIDLTYVRDSPQCASLLWMGYPGQSGGLALASVIFGQYNPAGRLPVTIYPSSYVTSVSMFDMAMHPSAKSPGRTYKFYTGTPVYEFGSGLSYTTFSYSTDRARRLSTISINDLMPKGDETERLIVDVIRVNVTNTGDRPGDDVVLAYVSLPETMKDNVVPFKQLFGFERVHLAVNETREVFFPFSIRSALTVDRHGTKWIQPGSYRIRIGKEYLYEIRMQGEAKRLM